MLPSILLRCLSVLPIMTVPNGGPVGGVRVYFADEIFAFFDDVPFHASTYCVATDTTGRKYTSKGRTVVRSSGHPER